MSRKKNKFHCKSDKQKKAIAASYARKMRSTVKVERIEAPYPHFRYYRKSGHPALIVGEQLNNGTDEYRYRKVSHSEKDGRHCNEVVYPNPDPKDKESMYIAKRIRHDNKENFEPKPLPWNYLKKGQ